MNIPFFTEYFGLVLEEALNKKSHCLILRKNVKLHIFVEIDDQEEEIQVLPLGLGNLVLQGLRKMADVEEFELGQEYSLQFKANTPKFHIEEKIILEPGRENVTRLSRAGKTLVDCKLFVMNDDQNSLKILF